MKRNEKLTVYYHCNKEFPQIISMYNKVTAIEDYEYPGLEPVVVSLRQQATYFDADLKKHVTTKNVRFFVGKVEDAELVISHPNIYKVPNPIEFYENCKEGKIITYISPRGKVYTTPKTNCTKAFETEEELHAGVDKFVTEFLNEKSIDDIIKVPDTKHSAKVYTK